MIDEPISASAVTVIRTVAAHPPTISLAFAWKRPIVSVFDDKHHDRHDRRGDNSIDDGAPHQHLDRVERSKGQSEADQRRSANNHVEAKCLRKFSLQC